jgi:regulator of sirC expression with transglutaminase-like and TPR domain
MDFSALAALSDERIDVITGALLIAKDEYPGLDVERERSRLDELAKPLGRLDGLDAAEQATLVSEYLFGECGFRGNSEDYYDPKNTFLNDVLDRRRGIPISLSVVYAEVAKRGGVVANGIGFPGHFLVRIESESSGPIVVDPFGCGRIVGPGALDSLLERAHRRARKVDRSLLQPAPPRAVLVRMLMNLKGIYASRGELARLLVVLSRILELEPDSPNDRRDRGLIAMRLGSPRVAESDLRRYLELSPEAGDVPEVRRALGSVVDRGSPAN